MAAALRKGNSQVPTESKRREDKCSLYPYSSVACPRGTGASMPSSFARGEGTGLWGFGDVMFVLILFEEALSTGRLVRSLLGYVRGGESNNHSSIHTR